MLLSAIALTADVASNAAAPQNGFTSLVPLLLIGVVMYLLMIRPQQKRMKTHQQMLAALGRGDMVVTEGGLIGKITRIDEEKSTLSLEIASGVEVNVSRFRIAEQLNKDATPVAKEKAGENKKSSKAKAKKG